MVEFYFDYFNKYFFKHYILSKWNLKYDYWKIISIMSYIRFVLKNIYFQENVNTKANWNKPSF